MALGFIRTTTNNLDAGRWPKPAGLGFSILIRNGTVNKFTFLLIIHPPKLTLNRTDAAFNSGSCFIHRSR